MPLRPDEPFSDASRRVVSGGADGVIVTLDATVGTAGAHVPPGFHGESTRSILVGVTTGRNQPNLLRCGRKVALADGADLPPTCILRFVNANLRPSGGQCLAGRYGTCRLHGPVGVGARCSCNVPLSNGRVA